MSSVEFSFSIRNVSSRLPGEVLAGMAGVYLRHVNYEGLENIRQIEEILKSRKSVLLVSDHPTTLTTMWTANVVTMLDNRKETGILVKDDNSPENNTAMGYVIRQIVAHHRAEPLFVKTKEPNEVIRKEYNQKAIDRGNEILGSPSGVLLLYAQGTRDKNMIQAKSGLANFGALAGSVVPMTTINDNGQSEVVIHPPIPGKTGIAWCVKNFGTEDGPKVFSNLVMGIIATAQPNVEKKGVYEEVGRGLENYIGTRKLDGNITYDEPVRRVLSAFVAWEKNEFGQ
jgi:hypothetical protein